MSTNFIQSLPKAELHLHLEGSVEPETLAELSRRHGTPFIASNPAYSASPSSGQVLSVVQARALYNYSNFMEFLFAFKAVTERLRTPDDFELITYRLMERLNSENIVHAEVYISVGVYLWRGDDFDVLFQGMERGRERGERDFGISLLWLFDSVRQFGAEAAYRVLEKAVQFRHSNVVGLGIGGDERLASPELFREVYAQARALGLRLTAHAGETAGPESISGALDALGAERLGHALTAYQSRELLSRLVREQIPLEICLTSNLRTGCCPDLSQHPLGTYLEEGALVTLSTDDPAMFGTSLVREYQLAQKAFGLSNLQLRLLAANSFRASFLSEQRKQHYLQLLEALPASER
jgi:adenosine deaminase/aminodeoxyfutalosine deaminase